LSGFVNCLVLIFSFGNLKISHDSTLPQIFPRITCGKDRIRVNKSSRPFSQATCHTNLALISPDFSKFSYFRSFVLYELSCGIGEEKPERTRKVLPNMRSAYPHSQSGTGVAFLLGENGEDNAGRTFLFVHCFVHRSLANSARYRVD
jgi:hypothetical protein